MLNAVNHVNEDEFYCVETPHQPAQETTTFMSFANQQMRGSLPRVITTVKLTDRCRGSRMRDIPVIHPGYQVQTIPEDRVVTEFNDYRAVCFVK